MIQASTPGVDGGAIGKHRGVEAILGANLVRGNGSMLIVTASGTAVKLG